MKGLLGEKNACMYVYVCIFSNNFREKIQLFTYRKQRNKWLKMLFIFVNLCSFSFTE